MLRLSKLLQATTDKLDQNQLNHIEIDALRKKYTKRQGDLATQRGVTVNLPYPCMIQTSLNKQP